MTKTQVSRHLALQEKHVNKSSYGNRLSNRTWTQSFSKLVGGALECWDAMKIDTTKLDDGAKFLSIDLKDVAISMVCLPKDYRDRGLSTYLSRWSKCSHARVPCRFLM